jgi:hypothetical protein
MTRTALTAALFASALSLIASAPAHAQQVQARTADGMWGIAVGLDLYGLRRIDDGRRMFGGGKERRGRGLEVGYDLLRVGEGVQLAVAIGWLTEKQEPTYNSDYPPPPPQGGRMAGFGTGLESNSLYAAAAFRWRADRALQPYLGLAGGATRAKLTLDGGAWPSGLYSKADGFIGRASAGVRWQPRFLTIKRVGTPVLGFAAAAELGALVGTSLTFTSRLPDPPSAEKQPIAVQAVSLGSVGQTGAYGRLSLMILF